MSNPSSHSVQTIAEVPIEHKKKADEQIYSLEVEEDPSRYDPPDGGLEAWMSVAGGAFVGFSTFGFLDAFGVFVDFYTQTYETNYSATVISMIGSLQVFVLYTSASIAGPLFDAFGPRIMISFSGVVVVFSLMMLSLTQPNQIWQQYLCQTILFSLGATSGFFSVLGLMTHWFRRRASLTLGIAASSASVGGIIHPIVLRRLIPKIGFGWAVRVVAFICLFSFICALALIRPRRPKTKLPPLRTLLPFEAFKDPCFVVLAIGGWLICFALFNPSFYVGLYASVASGESALTPYYLTILSAGSIIGRLVPGVIADKYGRFNVMIASMYLAGIFILGLWYPSTSQPSLIAFAFLYGFFSGPFFSLMPACVAYIAPIERIGAYTGIYFAFLSTGAFAGSPIGGAFIKTPTLENFRHMILYSGLVMIVGTTLVVIARLLKNRDLRALI